MLNMLTTQFNETPETMLGKLFCDMCKLSEKLASLEIGGECEKEFSDFMRKIYLSMDTFDKYVIAVAGLQGVGKTFFLRHYLKLDDSWLKDNTGRGERYPVLVLTDPSISEPRGVIRRLVRSEKGLLELQEQEVSPDEFRNTISSELENLTMLPVLRVPHVTPYPHLGFLLLPGYEKERSDWQELMCHAMLSAGFPIIVTDSQALASDGTKAIREDLRKKYLDDVEAIVVYSKIDEEVPRPQEASFDNVKAFLGIKDEKRLVFTGSGSEEYIEAWRNDINKVIGDSSIRQDKWRQKQLIQLKEMLSREMQDILAKLSNAISEKEIFDESSKILDGISRSFDKSRRRLRKDFEKILNDIVGTRVETAKESATSRYNSEEADGFFPEIGRKIRDFLCDDDRKERAINTILNESWKETYGSFTISYLDRVTDLTLAELGIKNAGKTEKSSGNKVNISDWVLYPEAKQTNDVSSVINDAILENIRILFSDIDVVRNSEQDACFERTIRLLPVLALEFSRLNTVQSYVKQRITVPGAKTGFPDDFENNTNAGKKIIKSIGYMLAIDVCADGKIDTIPALWNLISGGAGAGAAAAAANPYVLAAVALFAVGTMGYTLKEELNNEHGRCRQSLRSGISALGAAQKTDFLDNYDTMMDRLWDSIEIRFRQRHKMDVKLGRTEGAKHLIAGLKEQKNELLGLINVSTVIS